MTAKSVPRPLARLSVAAAALFIAAFTLLPSRGPVVTPASWCLFCGEQWVPDVLLNVALFAPLGAALAAVGMRPRPAVLMGAMLSACIELAQVWIPGRDPSVRDVLSNTLGAGLGTVLLTYPAWWLSPPLRLARGLAMGWTAAAVSAAWLTMWLLQPAYPTSIYYGQWTANLGHLEWYRGRVLSAEVGSMAVRSQRVDDSRRLRNQLQAESPIVVRATAGPPTSTLGPLFSIYDHRQREIILIGPDRNDLVYRFRSRGSALSLQSPEYRARGLLGDVRRDDSLHVTVTHEDRELCLSVNSRRACGRFHGPEVGWSLLYSASHLPGWLVALLNVAWLVVLAAPTGFWSRGSGTLATCGVALVTGTAWASAHWGAPWSLPSLWTAVGLGLGSLTSRVAARHAQRRR